MSVLALLVSLAAAGCEKSPRDRLQGRWLGESIENVPVDQVQKATGWVKGTAIEFAFGRGRQFRVPWSNPRTCLRKPSCSTWNRPRNVLARVRTPSSSISDFLRHTVFEIATKQ